MNRGFPWSMVPDVGVVCLDNTNATEVDFTGFDPTVFMAEWREGRGEIETRGQPGLRTIFYDPTPYAAMFQRGLTILAAETPPLTLAQAQKVQTDLVQMIYDAKRQAPIAYTFSGTSYEWSAFDEDIAAMAIETIPFISGAIQTTGGGTTTIVGQINAMIDQINSSIVSVNNANAAQFNVLNPVVNYAIPLLKGAFISTTTYASPGTDGRGVGSGNFGNNSAIAHISGPGGGAPIIVAWSPIGANAPLNTTMTDITNIMNAIATRRQGLLNTRNTKANAIAALATIAAVIAYDVTAGW
jgi:hypothetical protein